MLNQVVKNIYEFIYYQNKDKKIEELKNKAQTLGI